MRERLSPLTTDTQMHTRTQTLRNKWQALTTVLFSRSNASHFVTLIHNQTPLFLLHLYKFKHDQRFRRHFEIWTVTNGIYRRSLQGLFLHINVSTRCFGKRCKQSAVTLISHLRLQSEETWWWGWCNPSGATASKQTLGSQRPTSRPPLPSLGQKGKLCKIQWITSPLSRQWWVLKTLLITGGCTQSNI